MERFTISVITGRSSSMHNFSSHVGIGSSLQDALDELMMRARTSDSVTVENE